MDEIPQCVHGRMSYHATIREGVWKYEQIVDSELVRTCEVLGGSKESEIDSSEHRGGQILQSCSDYRGVSSENS